MLRAGGSCITTLITISQRDERYRTALMDDCSKRYLLNKWLRKGKERKGKLQIACMFNE